MVTRVKKWGNSLALRIPKPLAQEVGLTDDSPVHVVVRGGKLEIEPAVEAAPSLEDLLAGVSKMNLHSEVDWGSPVGKETW